MNEDLGADDFTDSAVQKTTILIWTVLDMNGNDKVNFETYLHLLVNLGLTRNYRLGWKCLSALRQRFNQLCTKNEQYITFASLLTFLKQQQHFVLNDNECLLTLTCNDSYFNVQDTADYIAAVLPVCNLFVPLYTLLHNYQMRSQARSRLMENEQIVVEDAPNQTKSWDSNVRVALRHLRLRSPESNYLCASKDLWDHLHCRQHTLGCLRVLGSPPLKSSSSISAGASSKQTDASEEYRYIDDASIAILDSTLRLKHGLRTTLVAIVCLYTSSFQIFCTSVLLHMSLTSLQHYLRRQRQANNSHALLKTLFVVRTRLDAVDVDWSLSGIYRSTPMNAWEIFIKLTKDIRAKTDYFLANIAIVFCSAMNCLVVLRFRSAKADSDSEVLWLYFVALLYFFSFFLICNDVIFELQQRIVTLERLLRFRFGHGNWGDGGEPVLCMESQINIAAYKTLRSSVVDRVMQGTGLFDMATIGHFVSVGYMLGVASVVIAAKQWICENTYLTALLSLNTLFLSLFLHVISSSETNFNMLLDQVNGRKSKSSKQEQQDWHLRMLSGVCFGMLVCVNLKKIEIEKYSIDTVSCRR